MRNTECEKCKVNKYCGTCITCEQAKEMYQQGRADAVDGFAKWLVEQGILGNRCISDGEITDYGKVYAKKYKEQLKVGDKE